MESLLQILGVPPNTVIHKALAATDRAHFVPQTFQKYAYKDAPQPLGYNATISAPHMHLFACERLHDHLSGFGGDHTVKVLDVGSGSGFLVAAFARVLLGVLGGGGRFAVVGVEHVDQLVTQSRESLRSDLPADLLSKVQVHTGDGYEGWSEEAPFDFIHVGAACKEVPAALAEQLRVGGVIVLPVESGQSGTQYMQVMRKDKDGQLKRIGDKLPVAYVPLTSIEGQQRY